MYIFCALHWWTSGTKGEGNVVRSVAIERTLIVKMTKPVEDEMRIIFGLLYQTHEE